MEVRVSGSSAANRSPRKRRALSAAAEREVEVRTFGARGQVVVRRVGICKDREGGQL